MTRVVEDWGVQYQEVKSALSEGDIAMRYLQGSTLEEKEVDSKLLSLAPFFGHDNTFQLAQLCHRQLQLRKLIETRQEWQRLHIKTPHEGQLYDTLMECAKDGRIAPSNVEKWNRPIQDYYASTDSREIPESAFLSHKEIDFLHRENIDAQLYLAIKDAILREFEARQSMPKEEAIRIDPEYEKSIGTIYDFLKSVGWVQG